MGAIIGSARLPHSFYPSPDSPRIRRRQRRRRVSGAVPPHCSGDRICIAERTSRMAAGRGKGWVLIALVVLVVLIAGGIIGFRVAVGVLKGKVVEALGSDSEIKDIRVGWASVDVGELRIKGPRGWPVADTLRAEPVVIVPSLRSVLSRQIGVQSITIVRPYLSA